MSIFIIATITTLNPNSKHIFNNSTLFVNIAHINPIVITRYTEISIKNTLSDAKVSIIVKFTTPPKFEQIVFHSNFPIRNRAIISEFDFNGIEIIVYEDTVIVLE